MNDFKEFLADVFNDPSEYLPMFVSLGVLLAVWSILLIVAICSRRCTRPAWRLALALAASLPARKAFTLEADFSGIDGDPKNLRINAVLHQTYVDVNEQGTEAAAATVDHWRMASSRLPVRFVCDRPFLFLIHAVKAGTILFIGRVNDPSQPALAP